MYYHCRPLKYVEYGKVDPPPEETLDFLLPAYKWLGHYCGYCPQIWLSRSRSSITGYRSKRWKDSKDSVLFGFDIIKGFPLSFDHWDLILSTLINHEDGGFDAQNKAIKKMFDFIYLDYRAEDEELEGPVADWVKCDCDLDRFLNECLFHEVDQVVVPSLNLKSAKKIVCKNEKQKRKLRKMGFIEDRISIKNLKTWTW